ncbi:MAG: helix-turn-helix domain-containing protein [Burkholderiales bacterium]
MQEAAQVLKVHPKTLAALARAGAIPSCKVGKAWVFVESMLIEYLVAQCKARVSVADTQEKTECRSSDEQTRPIIGSSCRPSVANPNLYRSLLGLPSNVRRRSSTTG